MLTERQENSILVLSVSTFGKERSFSVLKIEDLDKIGKLDDVRLGCFVGDYGFLSHNWIKLEKAKLGTFWHLFERQNSEFVEKALKYWGM